MSADPSTSTPAVDDGVVEGFDLAALVQRWRGGDLDAEGPLQSELVRRLRPLVHGRTGPASSQLHEAVSTVMHSTSPLRRPDPAWDRMVPGAKSSQWKRWPVATFVAAVVATLAERRDDIATLDMTPPADDMPVAQRVMLRLCDIEGLEPAAAGAVLGSSRAVAVELLDEAHHTVGMDPSGQVLCRGWQAVRAMDQRGPSERAEAQRHLANCRACGHAYADRLRRREFLLRLLPIDAQRHPILPVERADDLQGVDATEAMNRA